MGDYDYERRAAEKWKSPLVPPHRRVPLDPAAFGASQQYLVPDIARLIAQVEETNFLPEGVTPSSQAENKARAAEPPDALYDLPIFAPKGFSETFFGNRNHYLEHIATKTSTHLSLAPRDDINRIEIWGSKDAVAQAKRDLDQLRNYVLKSLEDKKEQKSEVDRIAKIKAAPTLETWKTIFAHQEQYDKRHFFQKMPEHRVSEVMGFFSWPKEYNSPQEYFGQNCHSLDDVRMDHECYIDYDREKKCMIILGSKPADVENAVDRVFGAFCEASAKNRNPVRVHLLEPPAASQLMSDVYLDQQHPLVNRQITVQRSARNCGVQCYLEGHKPTRIELLEWEQKRKSILKANNVYLRRVVQQALYDIHYCRRHVRMKVNFGTLVLFKYPTKKSSFPILEFMEEVIREKSTHSELLRLIGNMQVAEELKMICRQRSSFFLPVHKGNPIVDGHPELMYSATFDLKLSDKNKSQDIRLEVQFGGERRLGGKYQYSVVAHSWLITPNRQKSNSEGIYRRNGPLDLKCLDLVAGSAWQLEISTYPRLRDTEIFPIFPAFLNLIRLDVDSAGNAIIGFTSLPCLDLKAVVLKTKAHWYLSHSDYIFEVTKYEYFNGIGKRFLQGVASNVGGVKPDVRWGAGLCCELWTQKLADHPHLPIGRPGRWDPDIYKFFEPSKVGGMNDKFKGHSPPPKAEWEHNGFEEFLGRVRECMELITYARERTMKREDMARRGVRDEDMD